MAKVIEMTTKKASAADIRARLEAGKQTEADLVVQRDQAHRWVTWALF